MKNGKVTKLQDKFLRQFIVPILIGILGSIGFSVFFLTYFSNYYFKRDIVKEEIKNIISYDNRAKIKSLTQLVYTTVQGDISKLEKIRDSYHFISKLTKYPSITNELQIKDNIFNISSPSPPSQTFKKKPLDYGRFFINSSFPTLTPVQKYQLYTLTELLILLKAIIELENEPNQTTNNVNFIVYFESNELYFDYPFREDDLAKFKEPMPQWCLKDGLTPNYYYFKCSKYYYKMKDIKQGSPPIQIGDVYSTGIDFNYFVCLKAKEPSYVSPPTTDFSIIFCITKPITKLWKQLDEFNAMLQGYFFIYSVNSLVPFYYPKSLRKKVIDNIKREEFYLNSSFYIDESLDYNLHQAKFSQSYNGTTDGPSFSIMKNNDELNCNIDPIYYHFNEELDGGEKSYHYQSIILISNFDFNNQYKYITDVWIKKNIIQGIIFFLAGLILIKLIIYMIMALADSIVRPIKNIKRILKRLNTNKKRESSNTSNVFKNKSHRSMVENNNNNNANDNINNNYQLSSNEDNNPLITENNNNNNQIRDNNELQHETNEEDEYISTRSKDVNTVFYKLVDLKNSLEALSNESLTFVDNNLLNYIFAQHNFHVINNMQASHLCNSNIGNLLLKSKQYDKAIFHFQDSIKEINEEEVPKINLNNITSIDDYLAKLKKSKGDIMKKADMKKKKLIESRYPKLLYAYKKYFKSFKQLKNDCINDDNLTLNQHNEFSSIHLISKYKEALIHYIEIAFDYGDKYNIKVALIEYLNFILDYELIENSHSSAYEKKEFITEIFHIFSLLQVQENQKTKDQMQLEVNQLMLLIQNLKLQSDIVDQIKIPSSVLNQKVIYLKGKLYFICGHYKSALNLFYETLQIDLVSDAKIVLLSLQKIVQIAEKYYKAIDDAYNHMQSNRRDGLIKIIEELQLFIQKKKEQISSFDFIPKDICIIMTNKIQLSKALDIYENMISEYDRVTFIYYEERKKVIQLIGRLTFKSNSDIEEIRNYFKSIEDNCNDNNGHGLGHDMNTINTSNVNEQQYQYQYGGDSDKEDMKDKDNNANEIESILIWARNYVMKKTSGNIIREKWFIYLKNSLSDREIQYLIKSNIKKDLFWDSPWYNLAIVLLERSNIKKDYALKPSMTLTSNREENVVLIGKNKEEEEQLVKKLSFNKSGIIFNDIMEVLREKMSIRGIIHKRNEFPQEKYEDVK